jgi:hypothetical protein
MADITACLSCRIARRVFQCMIHDTGKPMNPTDKPSDSTNVKSGDPPVGKPHASTDATNVKPGDTRRMSGRRVAVLGAILIHPLLFLLLFCAGAFHGAAPLNLMSDAGGHGTVKYGLEGGTNMLEVLGFYMFPFPCILPLIISAFGAFLALLGQKMPWWLVGAICIHPLLFFFAMNRGSDWPPDWFKFIYGRTWGILPLAISGIAAVLVLFVAWAIRVLNLRYRRAPRAKDARPRSPKKH